MSTRKFSSSVIISRNDWSGLQTGRIATIHGARGTSLRYRSHGEAKAFVMEGRNGALHVLNADATDCVRLNSHFLGFQSNAR